MDRVTGALHSCVFVSGAQVQSCVLVLGAQVQSCVLVLGVQPQSCVLVLGVQVQSLSDADRSITDSNPISRVRVRVITAFRFSISYSPLESWSPFGPVCY